MRRIWFGFCILALVLSTVATVDTGAPASAVEAPSFDPTVLALEPEFARWGVVGQGLSSHADEDHGGIDDWTGPQPEVWDLHAHGDVVYVGGIFTGVRRNEFWFPDDPVHDQAYLAAFDRATGDWISTWRPHVNGVVFDVSVTDDGLVLVGGEFTEVNGVARSGLVGLDPTTGEIVESFEASVSREWSEDPAWVKEIFVDGDAVYVAGEFSHVRDGDGQANIRSVVRLDAHTGARDTTWNVMTAGGSVWDLTVDHDRGLVHLVGYFTSVDALPNTARMATVLLSDGSAVPGLPALRTNHGWNNDTVTVTRGNDQTWVGGGNHLVNVLDPSTNGSLLFETIPGAGDVQVIEQIGDVMALGHHGSAGGGLIFYGAESHERIPVSLGLGRRTYGVWAIEPTADGCLWVGGDANRTRSGDWLGGIARFCPGHNPNLDIDDDDDGLADLADLSLTKVDSWPLVAPSATVESNNMVWPGGTRTWQPVASSDRFSSFGIDAEDDVRLSFVVGATPEVEALIIGLGNVEAGDDITDVDHGIYLRSGRWYVYESGERQAFAGGYDEGDDFAIEVVGTTVRYLHNGREVLTSATVAGVDWYVDSSAWGEGAQSVLQVSIDRPSSARSDADGDGVTNEFDLDSDGDGIADAVEAGLTDANGDFLADEASQQGSVTVAPDTDNDGVPDHLDLDHDGDGEFDIAGTAAATFDTNGDGRVDSADLHGGTDQNQNGVDDVVEFGGDGDGDGIPDARDTVSTDGPSRSPSGLATQSGTAVVDGEPLAASNAIDGEHDGDLARTAAGPEPWWELDLGAAFEVDGINLWNRLDCCQDDLAHVAVMIGDTPFGEMSLADAQASATWVGSTGDAGAIVQIAVPHVVGRYIRVQDSGISDLNLVEVDVFGDPSDLPPFGTPGQATLTTNGTDEVTVAWDEVANVKGYLVHRDFEFVEWLAPGTTVFIDDTVVAGETYRYQVRAQAPDNTYSRPTAMQSIHVAVDEGLPPFDVPANVTLSTNDTNEVTVRWERVADTKGYVIHREFEFVKWVAADADMWTDDSVVVGETYRYQVRAQAPDDSYSRPSPLQSISVFDDAGLAPFGTPSAEAAAVDGTSLVTWEPVAGAKGYVIHRDFVFVKWVPFTERTWIDEAVVEGQAYRYQVRAQAPDNSYSDPTPLLEVSFGNDEVAPSTPTGVLAERSADGTAVTVTWEPATDNVAVTSYLIHSNWSYVSWVPAGTTSFTHTGLDPDAVQRYQIRARDAADNVSDPSALTRVEPS